MKETTKNNIFSIPSGLRIDREEASPVSILDQTALPKEERWLRITGMDEAQRAILSLQIRGAPAIALFSAYVLAHEIEAFLSAEGKAAPRKEAVFAFMNQTAAKLVSTRPTAVNLSLTLRRFARDYQSRFPACKTREEQIELGWKIAETYYKEDEDLCKVLGRHGAGLIPAGARVLTHCNTGALATAGIGTAIGAFYTAHQEALTSGATPLQVYATETRPLLQGARLTAWELHRAGISVTLITDSTAAYLMQQKSIDLVMLGADRICQNGDTANKIGTLALAALARQFQIPFYVVAPSTSLDPTLPSGDKIEIEMRHADEVRTVLGHPTAPRDVPALNPAFDVTPGEWITAIITEDGIHRPPYRFE